MRLVASIVLVLFCGVVQAQPFSRIDVGGGLTTGVYSPDLRPWWASGLGGEASVRMPFYRGVLEAGGSIHHYSPRRTAVPQFTPVFAFAGWGVRARPAANLQVYLGGRLGIYTMVFDESSDVRDLSEYESEMAVSPVVTLERSIGGDWSVFVEAQQVVVLTAVRLDLTYLTVGAKRSLAAPNWLKSFLE